MSRNFEPDRKEFDNIFILNLFEGESVVFVLEGIWETLFFRSQV